MIDALRDRYRMKDLLSVFELAKSSYCYVKSVRSTADQYAAVTKEVQQIFHDAKGRYGYRRILMIMRRRGLSISEKVVRRIMRQEGMIISYRKRRKYCLYQGEKTPAVENVISVTFTLRA